MTDATVYLFLSGAEMDPSAVRAAHPGARFVARARVRANQQEIAAPFAAQLTADGPDEVWGILIVEVQGLRPGHRKAVTDDGREFEAVIDGPLASGEPEAVLAAARYWELPPSYVGRLRDAIGAEEAEPPDG